MMKVLTVGVYLLVVFAVYAEAACRDGARECSPNRQCIPDVWWCDGTVDCPGREDEANCTCRDGTRECAPGGLCLPKIWWCDGRPDCPGEEDEQNCSLRGHPGRPGPPGQQGAQGPAGPPGASVIGQRGLQGPSGPPAPAAVYSGAVYTRWGRNSCSDDAFLVYSGYAGGSHWTERGSGVNYVCLPRHPTWGNYDDRADYWVARMYGAEFGIRQRYNYNQNLFGPRSADELHDYEVLCAVCQSKTRSTVLMIPAKKECFDGWNLEYSGYLMAAFEKTDVAVQAKEYVCVDMNPNRRVGSQADQAGALFYFVEARCGSLPCPPYVQNRELTCAVCTK